MNQHEPNKFNMIWYDLMLSLVNQCEIKYFSESIWSSMNYCECIWTNMNQYESAIQNHPYFSQRTRFIPGLWSWSFFSIHAAWLVMRRQRLIVFAPPHRLLWVSDALSRISTSTCSLHAACCHLQIPFARQRDYDALLQIWQSHVGLLDSHCLPCNKASVAPGIRRGKGTQRAWWAQVQEVDQAHTVEWCHQGDAFHLQDRVEPFQERKRR